MSLLIKALDKAQEQARQAKSKRPHQLQTDQEPLINSVDALQANTQFKNELSSLKLASSTIGLTLEPNTKTAKLQADNLDHEILETKGDFERDSVIYPALKKPQVNQNGINANAQMATNVFTAKKYNPQHQSKSLIVFAVASLVFLLAIGIYFYQSSRFKIGGTAVIIEPPSKNLSDVSQEENRVNQNLSKSLAAPYIQPVAEPILENLAATTEVKELVPVNIKEELPLKVALSYADTANQNRNVNNKQNLITENSNTKPAPFNRKKVETSLAEDEVLIESKINNFIEAKVVKHSKTNTLIKDDDPTIASSSASMSVTKTLSQNSINPTLIGAFNAFNAGKDELALKMYKQVLQRDVHNSDALLGLAAIAQRQGRLADANGWYNKLLEVDPKNRFAMSFILENQPENALQNNETQIKNMLAKQPSDANLHALLGNYYAQNNQWAMAQQAYFDAYRLNANADNALNLAVSLDEMGKSKLALPYYLQALEIAQNSNSQIDKTSIEARITAIKPNE